MRRTCGIILIFLFLSTAETDTLNITVDDNTLTAPKQSNTTSSDYNVNDGLLEGSLDQSLRNAKKLGGIGTFLHFSGVFLEGVGISLLYNRRYKGSASNIAFSMIIVGSTVDIFSPIFSVVGASRLEKTIEREYQDYFHRNLSGFNYGLSWIMEGGAIGCTLLSLLIQRKNSNPHTQDNSPFPVLFNVLSVGFSIGGEVTRAISAIHPIVYARKAERYKGVYGMSVTIQPICQLDGAAGLALVFSLNSR
jgi:hypothetical protein